MPTFIDCPTCTRKLRVTEELFGTDVKCPACGELFTASPAASANGDRPATPEASPDATPRVMGETKVCPYCNEQIPVKATRCKHCREDLDGEERPWEQPQRQKVRRDCEPHRGTMVLTIGLLGLVVPILGAALGIAAWIMGSRDLGKIRREEMDPEGRGLTQTGYICGIIATGIQTLFLIGCAAYFGLVFFMVYSFRPTPPPPPPRPNPPPKLVPAGDMKQGASRRGIPQRFPDYLPQARV